MWIVANIVDRGGLDPALICRFPEETGVGKGAHLRVCVDTRPNKGAWSIAKLMKEKNYLK